MTDASLKQQFESELNLPHFAGAGDPTDRCGHRDVGPGATQVAVIREIEELGTELRLQALENSEVFHDAEVHDDVARSEQQISCGVAVGEGSGRRKCRRVEPAIFGTFAASERSSPDLVRTAAQPTSLGGGKPNGERGAGT